MSNEPEAFEGFAIVELMGRNVIAGYVTTQVIAGAAMLRVDVPAVEERTPFTKFFGGTSIYAITPCDEDAMLTAAGKLRTRPIDLWIVPERKALPAKVFDPDDEQQRMEMEASDDHYDDDDDEDGF